MTNYRRERTEKARALVVAFKLAAICANCGNKEYDPDKVYLTTRPETAYRKPIGNLVAGGASERRLMTALMEREVLCQTCFNVKRGLTWQEHHIAAAVGRRQQLMDAIPTTRATNNRPPVLGEGTMGPRPKRSFCPPTHETTVAFWATRNTLAGPCNGDHRYGVCTPTLTDASDGHILTMDEGYIRMKEDMKPFETESVSFEGSMV